MPRVALLLHDRSQEAVMRSILLVVVLLSASWPVETQAPQSPPAAPDLVAPWKPGNVERGRYFAEHVAMCIECHSERDSGGRIIPGRRFMGGQIPAAPPWAREWADRAPRNAGLPGYDDAAAMRLLTQGAIGREGRQLLPPMPRFRLSPEDAADVIAFMRSIP